MAFHFCLREEYPEIPREMIQKKKKIAATYQFDQDVIPRNQTQLQKQIKC